MKSLIKHAAVVATIALVASPLMGFAQPRLPQETLTYSRVTAIIDNVANILFGLLLAVTVFYVLYAAFLYLQGSDVDKAKTQLIYAAIAIAIALVAKGLPTLVYSITGISPS